MRSYLSSQSARLARVTLGLGILALGLTAMAGPEDGLYVIAGAPPILIVGSIWAIGLALAKHRLAAMVLLLGLPFLGGLYVGSIYAARTIGSAAGLAIGALGVAIVTATIINPVLRVPRREEAHA